MTRMGRFMPRSLGGQLLALLLLALVVTQTLSLILLADERNRAVRAALGLEAAGRAANVVLLLDEAPADLRSSIMRAANSPLVRFSIAPEPEATHDSDDSRGVRDQITQILGRDDRTIHVDIHALTFPAPQSLIDVPPDMRAMHEAMMASQPEAVEMTLSIALPGGEWLNVRTMFQRPGPQLSPQALLPVFLMILSLGLITTWTVGRVVRPIRALAESADRLGRGLTTNPLDEAGPSEIRATMRAFNRMQDRVTRHSSERAQMLAALSHDLRSPLTAMRLRIALLDETEDSLRLGALVDDMQTMVEGTLDYARGVAQAEPLVAIDLAKLLADLVSDVGPGKAVLSAQGPILATVRANSITRALRNLIDNAVSYGSQARVTLRAEPDALVIDIADAGPGLPEDQLETVFEPFTRAETSRNRETGGSGLGLAITRAIIQAHDGTVTLSNGVDGGLVAKVRLPRDDMSGSA